MKNRSLLLKVPNIAKIKFMPLYNVISIFHFVRVLFSSYFETNYLLFVICVFSVWKIKMAMTYEGLWCLSFSQLWYMFNKQGSSLFNIKQGFSNLIHARLMNLTSFFSVTKQLDNVMLQLPQQIKGDVL